jgi:hypothetical protein
MQSGSERQSMGSFGGYFGWRQLWLVCLGLCVWLVVQVVSTILPSRDEVAQAYLRRAIEIEKRFDFSLRNLGWSQLASRYAGVTGDEAVALIREKLHHAYSDSLTRSGLVALPKRNRGSVALTKVSGALLWLDGQPRLTPEAMANLNSELDQLTQYYQYRLGALPAQKRKAIAYGVVLVCLPMSLLYLSGVLRARVVEPPRAAMNTAPIEQVPAACSVESDAAPEPALEPADSRGARHVRFPRTRRSGRSFPID